MTIRINLDVMMTKRKIGLGELAEQIGITPVPKPFALPRWMRFARPSTASPATFSNGRTATDNHRMIFT